MNIQCGTFRRVLALSIVVTGFLLSIVDAVAQTQPWIVVMRPNRFVVLSEFGNSAVLDQVTGLIWERAPNPNPLPSAVENFWRYAQDVCHSKVVNNQMGWRLPKVEELTSLVDQSMSNPALPPAHPFQNIGKAYWAATPYASVSSLAYTVRIGSDGHVQGSSATFSPSQGLVWCVRGGTN